MTRLFRSLNQSILVNSDIKVEFIGKSEQYYCFILSSLLNPKKEKKYVERKRDENIQIQVKGIGVFIKISRYVVHTKSVYLKIEHPKDIEVIPFEEIE